MLKHGWLRRQGKRLHKTRVSRSRSLGSGVRPLPLYPGIPHVDAHYAFASDLAPDPHLLGRSERQVYAGGVADRPAELVLTLVVVVEVGRLRLGHAAWEGPPPVPFGAGLPVVVVRVPGAHLLDKGPVPAPADYRTDGNPVTALELEPAVRQSDLVASVPFVVARVDLAAQATGSVG